MNADQLVKLAAFQAGAIQQDGSLAPFFTIPQLYVWLNDANFELEKSIRSIYDDYFVRVMTSTDTVAQKLMGIDYTPTTLQLAASTSRFTLPPDFQTMRSIRCVTSGNESMQFESKDMGHRYFQEYLAVASTYTVPPGGRIYYDIIGERTLFIVPQLTTAADIEIIYVARTKPLHRYATGTVAITDATDDVVGTSTVWSSGTPFDAAYLDIMFSVTTPTALTNVDISWVYDGGQRNRVASIDTDTTLTLAANKVATVAAGAAYILSSLPVLPPEHHAALADFVTAQMFAKSGKAEQFDRFMAKYEKRKASILNTINVRQPDVEYVEDYTTYGA